MRTQTSKDFRETLGATLMAGGVHQIRFDPAMDEVKAPIYPRVEGALSPAAKIQLDSKRHRIETLLNSGKSDQETRVALRALVAEYIQIFDEAAK